MKLTSLRSLTAVAALSAPIVFSASSTAQGLMPYLPKNTIMAVSAPDLSMSMAEFQKMPLAKMWGEEEVQTFLADVLDMAKEQMDEGLGMARQMHENGRLPVDPDELMKLRLNGGTFAVTNVEMVPGQWGPMPKFGFVLHLDFGESAPAWNKLIKMGLGMLEQEAGDQATVSRLAVGELELMTMTPPNNREGMEMALNVAMVPNGIVIGTLKDEVQGVLTAMTSKENMLAASAGYQAATTPISLAGAEAQVYMSPDPLVDFGLNVLRMAKEEERELEMVDIDGVERALQAMGMRDLGTMGMASSYEDGKCISKGFHAKKMSTSAGGTIDTSFLKWVPKDAVSFGASTIDAASLWDTLVKGLQAYDPDFAENALAQVGKLEAQLGFSIRKDLFGSLGDHYINWSMPMGTITSAPEVAMLMKVTNEEKLVDSLMKISAMTNGMVEIEEGTKRGLKAYQIIINYDPMDGMGMNPFDMLQPTFSFKDGYMVLGFSASDIKRVFRRMDREDEPKGDIRSNKEFMAVAQTIPEGVSSLSFTDWKANFESLYQVATGMLAFVPMPEDVPIDMALLPDSETLTKHLFAAVSYSKNGEAGTETVSVGPFGPETWLMMGALVGGAAGASAAMGRGF
ncbi:MAG: hypothetical protein AB8H80_03955 [Planctomycetota bacterium]